MKALEVPTNGPLKVKPSPIPFRTTQQQVADAIEVSRQKSYERNLRRKAKLAEKR